MTLESLKLMHASDIPVKEEYQNVWWYNCNQCGNYFLPTDLFWTIKHGGQGGLAGWMCYDLESSMQCSNSRCSNGISLEKEIKRRERFGNDPVELSWFDKDNEVVHHE